MARLPDLAEAREAFVRDGVVHIPGFVPRDELATIESHLDEFVDRRLHSDDHDTSVILGAAAASGSFRVLEDFGHEPFFDALGRAPRFTELAAVLLDEAVAPAVRDQYSPFGWQALFNLEPGTTDATPPHQDNCYYNFSPNLTLSVWIALDDVDEHNGALRYVRGSHLEGRRRHELGAGAGFSLVVADHGPADLDREVCFDLARGDVVAHHGLTVHRSEPNRSTRRRWGHSLFFRAQRCTRDEDAHLRYLANLDRHQALTAPAE